MEHDWNERYASGDLPWDTGSPDPLLVETLAAGTVPPCRALEIGCGTGTNSLFLASRGFEVLGLDVAPLAVERARAKAAGQAHARFDVGNFLAGEPPAGPFRFVFDRGCFHTFDAEGERVRFASRVASVLEPGGCWLSLIGSTEGPPRDFGPPRRSLRDVANAIEPALELVLVRSVHFHADLPSPPQAWLVLSRRRA